MGQLVVRTNGQTLLLTAATNPAGSTVGVWSDSGLSSAVTLPATVSADTTYYLRDGDTTITVTQPDGSVVFSGAVSIGAWPREVTPVPTNPQVWADVAGLSATYARLARVQRTLDCLRSIPGRGIGLTSAVPTTSDAPTIANNAAAFTITTNFASVEGPEAQNGSPRISLLGGSSWTFNSTFSYITPDTDGTQFSPTGYGFTLTGTEVEIQWRAGGNAEALWIWVDGRPTTAAPFAPAAITVTNGNTYYTKLTWGASGTRRVEVYHALGFFRSMRFQHSVSATTPLPEKGAKLFAIGDSFLSGSTLIPALQTFARRLAFASGMELYQAGQGGSGYTVAGTGAAMTDTTRISPILVTDPDVLLLWAGINDAAASASAAATQAAVASVLAQVAAGAPKVPVIVVGTQPSSATTTLLSATAVVNKAIRDAAAASSNCIGFIDCIGNATTGTVPAALSNGQSYVAGDLYTFGGTIYEVLRPHTGGATPNTGNTRPRTWLSGTGNTAVPAADGNRDLFMSNDGTHWSLDGAGAQAAEIAKGMERICAAFVNGNPFTSVTA